MNAGSVLDGDHVDAIDRAWGQTQLTARALRRDDGVHLFLCTKNRIDGAGLDAQRTANATCLINDGDHRRLGGAVFVIEGQRGFAQ